MTQVHHDAAAIATKIRRALAKIEEDLAPKMIAAYREAGQHYEAMEWRNTLDFSKIDKACRRLEERAAKMAREKVA